jgi:4-aminobutyrate aminotransferase-like enzyme
MSKSKPSPLTSLLDAPRVREAAAALLDAVAEEAGERALTPAAYRRALREVERLSGRALPFPMLASGTGRGARLRAADGTTKIDFAGGVGVYGFGHGDRDLLETAAVAAAGDTVFQSHLTPGPEYLRLARALLRHAGPRIKHAWLSITGAIANENALKLILQKHSPAEHVIVFDRAFAGHTLALSEFTDRPEFREGLPLRGNVLHVPFFAHDDPDSTEHSIARLEAHLDRHPGRIAAMLFELIQGEAGVHTAPRSFFVALMERCRAAKIAIWVDEIQTFARTDELFAFRTLGLEEFVDVVTAGNVLQGSAALFTKKYNPRPGLISGNHAGSTVGMAVGTRIIERLESDGFLGPEGRIAVLGRRVERRFEALRKRLPRIVGERSGTGATHAFVPFDGAAEVVEAVQRAAFEEGLLLLSAGTEPTRIRMLLPVNITDEELEAGFSSLEKALRRVAEERDLRC